MAIFTTGFFPLLLCLVAVGNCFILDSLDICSRPPSPQAGSVHTTGESAGSLAFYLCDNGFSLTGVSPIKCEASGQWNPPPPECRQTGHVGQIVTTAQNLMTPVPTKCHNHVCYHGNCVLHLLCACDDGWTGYTCDHLSGDGSATGTINPPSTTITTTTVATNSATCSVLIDPANGVVSLSGTTDGSIAFFSCNNGFTIHGPQVLTCQQDGQWSSTEPDCIKNCNLLTNPLHGSVQSNGYVQGSIATYTCINGYILVGTASRACDASGHWSGTDPLCLQKNTHQPCPQMNNEHIAHGFVTTNSDGDAVRYQCLSGFVIVGNEYRTCQNDGTWSGQVPSCVLQ